MDFFEVIEKRRSIRKFLKRPVEAEKVERILSAALHAPSARGSRSWEFVAVTDAAQLERLATAKPDGAAFLKNAPLAVVVCTDPAKSGPSIEDAAIAGVIMQLAAQALGLGSCWVHFRDKAFSSNQSSGAFIAALLQIPSHLQVECAIAIGYPDQAVAPYRREDLPKDKISHNRYGNAKPA